MFREICNLFYLKYLKYSEFIFKYYNNQICKKTAIN